MSLCDGMSCGQIALKNLCVKVKEYYAYEIKPSAIYATQLNFPQTVQLGDVNDFDAEYFKDKKIDILLCGSPCQDMSNVKHGREGIKGKKSSLFYKCADILDAVRPSYFLFENVKSMRNIDRDTITERLGATPIMIDSQLVSAQRRKRYYWTNIPNVEQPNDKGIKLSDILEENPIVEESISQKAEITIRKRLDKNFTAINGDKSITITCRGYNSKSTQYVENERGLRCLTTLEYRRLQTIPDWYDFGELSKAKITDLLGDGWTVDVISHILSYISGKNVVNSWVSILGTNS